jgi:hypothetical protein
VTAAELIAIVREDLLDDVSDTTLADPEPLYRWSTAFLLRQAALAQRQACWRQDLRHLFDDTTGEICSIALVEGQATYRLDSRILRLQSVLLPAADGGLSQVERVWPSTLDTRDPSWRTQASGLPRWCYVAGGKLVLSPAPALAQSGATLSLAVWREPLLSELEEDDDLEWVRDQEQLGHWMAYQALSRRDPDLQDAKGAQMHLATFERVFGTEVSARARQELLEAPDALQFTLPRASRRECDDFLRC